MKKLICGLLAVLLCACSAQPAKNYKSEEEFNAYIQTMPALLIDSSSTIVNQFFKNEKAYGFEEIEKTWPEYDLDTYLEELKINDEVKAELENYDRDSLSERNKIIYDMLSMSVQDAVTDLDDEAYFYLANCPLGYYEGEMSSIALVFMFFNLYDELDIQSALNLARTLPEFVDSLVAFEQERQDKGYGMTPREISLAIESYEDLLTKDYMFIVDDFEEKIMAVDFIDETEKQAVFEEFTQLIHDNYPLAFQKAIDGLNNLEVKQGNIDSLADLPQGSQYYKYLVESKTGYTDGDEYLKYLDDCLNQVVMEFQLLYQTSGDPTGQQATPSLPVSDPNEMLLEIRSRMSTDFPELKELNYEMSYLPEGLEELMPNTLAFYKNSSYDDTDEKQVMMLNGRFEDFDFNTIAHEGYPGHMYQRIYNIEHGIPVIQDLLAPLIYSEGYATYVADFAAKYSDKAAYDKMMNLNGVYGTLILLQYEYRINVLNEDVSAEVKEVFGLVTDDDYQQFVDLFTMSPSVYIDYYVGYMQFNDIRNAYFEKNKNASDLDFHTDLLNLGPMQMNLLKEYMINGIK